MPTRAEKSPFKTITKLSTQLYDLMHEQSRSVGPRLARPVWFDEPGIGKLMTSGRADRGLAKEKPDG